MMRKRGLSLVTALSAVFCLTISAQAVTTKASEELVSRAGPVTTAFPEPELKDVLSGSRQQTTPSQARPDWLNAVRLYNDGVFTPAPQRRMDVNGSPLVMLQGFHWYADDYWYHPPKGWWGVLAKKAGEVSQAGFDLVWFPPVSNGSYYPNELYDLNSQWGKKETLIEAVRAMHAAKVKVIADVVLNHRNGKTNWLDFKNPDWPTTAITRDDEVWGQHEYAGLPRSPNYDEGQGEMGCRDLDHRDPLVKQDSKIFLRWLRHTVGFDGWRYDMVKGYAPHHVKDYNEASSAEFSVGEFYDGNRQLIINWIDGTDDSPGKVNASSAFDFTLRFSLIAAVEGDRYELLNDGGKPSGLLAWWPSKSVTFVESHDTSPRDPDFIANASAEYRNQRMLGYAYILTHPGIPCVFWPHFFDWGTDYGNRLRTLIAARKEAGVTSTSPVYIASATNGLYAAIITGKRQKLALKLGSNMSWNPGPGWTLITSGEKYAVWSQNR